MTKAIETSGLGNAHGQAAAVADLDIQVELGEAYILLGPRGGKDHHHPHASGSAMRPISGKPRCLALSLVGLGRVHRRVGYLPGDLELYPRLTGWQHLEWFAEFGGGSSLDRTGSSPSASSSR